MGGPAGVTVELTPLGGTEKDSQDSVSVLSSADGSFLFSGLAIGNDLLFFRKVNFS